MRGSSRILASLLSGLALTLGMTACPSPEPTPPDAGTQVDAGTEADAGTDAGTLAEVSGRRARVYLTDTGEVQVPVDLSAAPPQALVLEDGGTFVTYPGEGRADGTFTVPNVPAGTYYLRIDPTMFVVTNLREVDLSAPVLGRPGASTQPADAGAAEMVFELSNLRSWQATDSITLFSSNANVPRFRLTPSISNGATSGSFTYTVRATQPLIDSSQGDRVILTQLASRTATLEGTGETLPYRSVSHGAEAPAPFQMRVAEKQTTALGMTEQTPLTAPMHWDLAAYKNLAGSVNPRATAVTQLLVFDVLPTPLSYGYFTTVPRLIEIAQPPTSPEMRTTLAYANPYPSSWNPVGVMESRYQVLYTLPGTTTPGAVFASISDADTLAAFTSRKIAPQFGPVGNPRIEGKDAFQPITLTTPTPELTWTPPSSSPDMHYIVFVHELSVQGSATVSRLVGSVRTGRPGLRLPPGLMSPGHTYVIVFDSNTTPGLDITEKPFRISLPITGSQALSEIITVQ